MAWPNFKSDKDQDDNHRNECASGVREDDRSNHDGGTSSVQQSANHAARSKHQRSRYWQNRNEVQGHVVRVAKNAIAASGHAISVRTQQAMAIFVYRPHTEPNTGGE